MTDMIHWPLLAAENYEGEQDSHKRYEAQENDLNGQRNACECRIGVGRR